MYIFGHIQTKKVNKQITNNKKTRENFKIK